MIGPPIESLTLRDRWRFVKTAVRIEIRGGIPRLIVHEKYELRIKWMLRILAGIGIVLGGVTFGAWYYGVAAAIGVLAVQQLLERSVFEYTAIHVAPLPFRYDPAQWVAVGYGFARSNDAPDLVGPAFKDRDFAIEILRVIQSWNYGQPEDPDEHIRLSFILEQDNRYSVYVYPDPHRPSTEEFFKKYESESAKEKSGKRLQKLVFTFTFCKTFDLEADALVLKFHERNQGRKDFLLTTFFMHGSSYVPLADQAILKSSYKFKKRSELVKGEYEYWHGKNVMKLR